MSRRIGTCWSAGSSVSDVGVPQRLAGGVVHRDHAVPRRQHHAAGVQRAGRATARGTTAGRSTSAPAAAASRPRLRGRAVAAAGGAGSCRSCRVVVDRSRRDPDPLALLSTPGAPSRNEAAGLAVAPEARPRTPDGDDRASRPASGVEQVPGPEPSEVRQLAPPDGDHLVDIGAAVDRQPDLRRCPRACRSSTAQRSPARPSRWGRACRPVTIIAIAVRMASKSSRSPTCSCTPAHATPACLEDRRREVRLAELDARQVRAR